ncbi:TetR/AcrR family transcriptional regulator [Herbiconiux liangxiaofengii]|uniref:TetR/AcrR family transcriptional regulator n=1 Tax=Herbiconiux liangxiaofengii TaxID=3342795 RepID=UPI0035BB5492
MDARHRRSRGKLAEAVLRLASERPIDEVRASDIAAAAGVNRSTFYAHAASPLALLESVLREELDAIRDRYLAEVPRAGAAEAIAAATLAVLENVESHAAIYERGLSHDRDGHSGESSLRPMLAAHFEQSNRQLLQQHALFADSAEESADPLLAAMVGPYVANGSVGAIAAWLETPEPRDPGAFVRSYRRLVPEWFPLAP